jgi:hypothetical protein
MAVDRWPLIVGSEDGWPKEPSVFGRFRGLTPNSWMETNHREKGGRSVITCFKHFFLKLLAVFKLGVRPQKWPNTNATFYWQSKTIYFNKRTGMKGRMHNQRISINRGGMLSTQALNNLFHPDGVRAFMSHFNFKGYFIVFLVRSLQLVHMNK